MKQHILKHTSLIICVIIIIGFACVGISNYYNYSRIIKDDIENISKLTSSNIYSEIDSELTKPIFVSLTMANDSFLKSWLKDEQAQTENVQYFQKINEYLLQLKEKYNYNSVFLVSARTNKYYHFGGVHKTVSRDDAHDIWYYKFIDSNKPYDLDVDVDEADNNVLTVFVNCRIEDENGELMGVVGVGLKMNHLQNILKYYETNFNLQAFLVNPAGTIQVHTNAELIETTNLFGLFPVTQLKDQIMQKDSIMQTFWYEDGSQDNCLITKYIDSLEWYLIIEKNTAIIRKSLFSQVWKDSLIVLCTGMLLLMVSSFVIKNYKNSMTTLVSTDELTKLPNRRAFNIILQKCLNQYKQENDNIVFIFDIDHFKAINDTYGHLAGDFVITRVGQVVQEVLNGVGQIARWGGDEFFGIIHADRETAEALLSHMLDVIREDVQLQPYQISISVGATNIKAWDDLDSLLARADKGVYHAKTSGRNKIIYI